MPVFQDSENVVTLVPDGDYVFCVIGFECKLSTGPKTRSSDQFDFELEIELAKGSSKCFCTLIDHDSCAWKIDTFLKSSGAKVGKGEAFEFREDLAAEKGVKWINPLGLRGWCRLGAREYTRTGETTKRKVNEVVSFYTDKPKLAPREIELPEEERPF
jgi:hypothetical protein